MGVQHAGNQRGGMLLAVASAKEYAALARGLGISADVPGVWERVDARAGWSLVLTGVSKSNAAAGVARVLDPTRDGLVLSVGIAGALPGENAMSIGEMVVATSCVFSDEGLVSSAGFQDCAAMGFPLGDFEGSAVPVDVDSARRLSTALGARLGAIATVSTCSGTDEGAREVVGRTGAIAEAMEGAACALVAQRLGVAAGEVRVISNTTGERSRQIWDVGRAFRELERVGRLLGGLFSEGSM
ncbi:MAG: futalosine hydrolase [Phycisphaerales bacterium]